MGQAWCKERTKKAQDSKSPLDRVFVRCAHQIYPTLKQDGSVLGGATQRVTSSEIGYAGSPPREALTRGQSVDSIDRPFHPSEWVDVNLEVPSTPSSVITNLTANTSIYPTTTFSSTGSNLKSAVTPIPPPRRRRKNRGRPLPPKPDDIAGTHKNGKLKTVEPLYSSMKSAKVNGTLESSKKEKRTEEGGEKKVINGSIIEPNTIAGENHKVNGVNRALAINAGTREDGWTLGDGEEIRSGNARHDTKNDEADKNRSGGKIAGQEVEYVAFSKKNQITSSSTPKPSDRDVLLRDFVTHPVDGQDQVENIVKTVSLRSKNYSTVSLPNYDELEVVKMEVAADLTAPMKPGRAISTNSLPASQTVARLPQGLIERLEQYMTRSRSFGSLRPHEVIDKLKAQGELVESSDEDDDWGGLDDWDLGVIEYQEPGGRPPLEPSSRLKERKTTIKEDVVSTKEKKEKEKEKETDDKFDAAVNIGGELDVSKEKDEAVKTKSESFGNSEKLPVVTTIPRNASFEMPKSPNSLKSALKAQANRKYSVPAKLWSEDSGNPLDDWFSAQERSVRFFDAPEVDEEFANTPGHRPAKPSHESHGPEVDYDTRRYPFNGVPTGPLNIDTFFDSSEDFGGTRSSTELKKVGKSLTRTLSNESEPFDGYEEKELTQGSPVVKLSRTISDESLPEMMTALGDDSLSEKVCGGPKNGLRDLTDSKTPPPSPEPKIKAEILENDSNIGTRTGALQKMSREDEAGSNLSSMTPSLTELEAALSDMLEKEDREGEEPVDDSRGSNFVHVEEIGFLDEGDGPIEPKIVPKANPEVKRTDNEETTERMTRDFLILNRRERGVSSKISLGEILKDSGYPGAGEKISSKDEGGMQRGSSPSRKLSPRRNIASQITGSVFKGEKGEKPRGKNPFEESEDEEEDAEIRDCNESKRESDISKNHRAGSHSLNPFDSEPPEKPSRLHKLPLDHETESDDPEVPTPPQRKNKHPAISPNVKTNPENVDSEFPIADSNPHPNDRLI